MGADISWGRSPKEAVVEEPHDEEVDTFTSEQKERNRAFEAATVQWHQDWVDAVGMEIRAHDRTLGKRRRQLVTQDHYGVADTRGWAEEIEYFIINVLDARLGRIPSRDS